MRRNVPASPAARPACRSRRASSLCAGSRDRARPCQFHRVCGSPAMTSSPTASCNPAASRPARCSRRSSRPASRRSGRGAWKACRAISPPCSMTAFIAANSTTSRTAPMRLWRKPLRMMVRERLTGQAPPPAARRLVDLWRSTIENKAGARPRPAGEGDREPAPVCRHHPRPARFARHGRGAQPRTSRRTTRTTARRTAARRVPAKRAKHGNRKMPRA